ncbi:hypothetical protein [Halobacteriovorax marinus]|uniref:hypothetical protein n=1 Tax=Halobacteriovorax marinus TaxID=97084 RepID=UPI0012FDE732|nr:hypothetical protein [Halobacteriovorax marinus]
MMENIELQEKLYDQYREELQLAYKSCLHSGQFFAGEFNHHINEIWAIAKDEGFTEMDFQEIIDEVANQYVDSVIYPFPTLMHTAA